MKIGSTFNHEAYGPLKITGKQYSRMGNRSLWIGTDEQGESHVLDGTEKPAKIENQSQVRDGVTADEDYIIESVIPRVLEQIRQPENGKDGADADVELIIREMLPLVMEKIPHQNGLNEALIIQKVVSRIRIPKDGKPGEKGKDGSPDTPVQVKDKLESLKGDERLDASAIKNLPKPAITLPFGGGGSYTGLAKVDATGTPGTLQEKIVAGNNVTITKTGDTLVVAGSAGGSGTPGGSDTQVQFNDGGSFGGDAGLVFNKTTNALGLGGDLNITSVDAADGTNRINLQTYENTASGDNNELIRLQFMNDDAKAAIAFVDKTGQSKIWVQAHDYLTLAPSVEHKHFSIEVTNAAGTSKYTRLSIPYDQDITEMGINLSNLTLYNNDLNNNGKLYLQNDVFHTGQFQFFPESVADAQRTYAFAIDLISSNQVTIKALGSSELYVADNLILLTNNVGIGTAAPATPIEVSKSDTNTTITTGNNSAIRISNPNTTTNNLSELAFCSNDMAAASFRTAGIVGVHTSHTTGSMAGRLSFLTRGAAYAERMRLTDTELSPASSGGITLGSDSLPFGGLRLSGAVTKAYSAITTGTSLDTTHHIVNCTSGTFSVTLPTAVGISGREYVVKNSGTGVITIATTSAQTIDGVSSLVLSQYDSYTVVSNGANWIII